MENRPQGREKNISGQGKGIKRRGDGLGTGKVGGSAGIPRPTRQGGTRGSTGGGRSSSGGSFGGDGGQGGGRAFGGSSFNNGGSFGGGSFGGTGGGSGKRKGGGGLIKIIVIVAVILLVLKLFSGLSGGGSVQTAAPTPSDKPIYYYNQNQSQSQSTTSSAYNGLLQTLLGNGYSGTQNSSNLTQGFSYSDLFGSSGSTSSSQPSNYGWLREANTGVLNTEVDDAAAAKRTKIKGKGKDKVTIMVYMCGTDLESRSAMATKDIQEMLAAETGDKVNLLIYTGGCSSWRNNVISSTVNQIYQVKDGKLNCLEKDMGKASMVKPATLTEFIEYCSDKFPANRNMLILWDHGGGSVSGYGYDEKYSRSGSMNLKGLNEALSDAGTTFDFIGYDACLMATLETALTMAPYADYLIASEETEPGVGWYYTNWLNALAQNTSLSTLEIGKKICDDFVDVCAQKCQGQKTTLSLTDLAELTAVVPESFSEFALSMSDLLENDGYATVSDARAGAREFAASSKIDQVDLVHMALNIDTEESKALTETILSAVKYNRTASNMTNAYGLSFYFPYKRTSQVSTAVETYDAVGISSEYTDCIKQFSMMQAGGQTAAGTSSPIFSLNGGSYGGGNSYGNSYGSSSSGNSSYGSSYGGSSSGGSSYGSSGTISSSDLLGILLNQMLGGGMTGGREINTERAANYILENSFNAEALVWQDSENGKVMYLPEEQWALVQNLELNVFVDVGDGYADLGLDNTFDFTEDGALCGTYDGTWIAIDGQEVAYYHIDSTITDDGYTITGRVPVLLNGTRADLILVFDSENPYGYIAGARFDYRDGETDTIAKVTELNAGDTIDYLCDFYTYDGEYDDSFMIGDQVVYSGEEEISNVYLSDDAIATYRFTDIYNNGFWTPSMTN